MRFCRKLLEGLKGNKKRRYHKLYIRLRCGRPVSVVAEDSVELEKLKVSVETYSLS